MNTGIIAIGFAAVVAMAAQAAAQTTTDCYTFGGGLHCQNSTPPAAAPQVNFGLLGKPPDFASSYLNGYAQGQRIAAERAAEQRAQAEANRENQERAAAWRDEQDRKMRAINAGQLIAAGHCDEARSAALNSGDLDLAAHVAALCSAPAN